MMKLEDIKIGMRIWTKNYWNRLITHESGTVTGIKYTSDGEPYAMVDWDNINASGALLSDIYPSLETLQQDEKERKERENKAVAEIKAKIHNVKDLVTFMYHTPLNNEEHINEKQAVRECAKELLGLDLEE